MMMELSQEFLTNYLGDLLKLSWKYKLYLI